MSAGTFHDMFVTTEHIPRTSIAKLPVGFEISCTRAGWILWMHSGPPEAAVSLILGEEFPTKGRGVRIEFRNVVLCDSLIHKAIN